MKHPLILIQIVLLLTCAVAAQEIAVDPNEEQALKLGTASWVKKQIKIIASDDMEGRETGTVGNNKAAAHIRKEYEKAGLKSLVEDGTYFQKFDVQATPSGAGCFVEWKRGRKREHYDGGGRRRSERHFVVFEFSGGGEVTAPVVFAGYGITAPEHQYDDYAQIKVKDKIVLVLRGEPRQNSDKGWEGRENTKHAEFRAKYDNAVAHGAKGIMIFSGANYPENRRAPQPPRGGRPTPVPPQEGEDRSIPAVWMDFDAVAAMVGGVKKITGWQKAIDEDLEPGSKVVSQLKATISIVAGGRRHTQNVVAYIEGSDPQLKDEFVVLGAHYDHVGIQADGKDRINNGADDNGSGTVALMTIAKMLGEGKLKPRRSIALLSFSGEEMGLLGSEYYVAHPLRPNANTVAMLNMDMVGRNFDSGCEVIGTQFSKDLRELIDEHRKPLKMKIVFKPGTGPERILERSDQAPFYKLGIPVAFFTTGLHSDYHKPSDHWNLIKTKNLAKIAQLITVTAMRVANADGRPAFEK